MATTGEGRGRRKLTRGGCVLGLSIAAMAVGGVSAGAAGLGGWGHLGDAGTAGTASLNDDATSLHATPGALYVGGGFTDAGGNPNADRIAIWNGSGWSAVSSGSSQLSNGRVDAIATSGGKVYAGGSFQDAGGNPDADFLAVWNGANWAPFCSSNDPGSAFDASVTALQAIGPTLYVGGSFQNGGGLASADYLLACDLNSGLSSSTVVDPAHPFSAPIFVLAADAGGNLYAGGGFINLENIAAADNVAYRDGTGWHAMGSGGGACGCAVTTFVRSLTSAGTGVYVGTDAKDVAGIPQADNVARWNGSSWSALGSNTAGGDGWFPAATAIDGMASLGSNVYATGSFENANGDPTADHVAMFDGASWHPVGSDGAGNGPWLGSGLALAGFDEQLYAAGTFMSAGGDTQARGVASYDPDTTPPDTNKGKGPKKKSARRKATFRFSSEAGATFTCVLDKKAAKPCVSPKVVKKLKRGKHVFRATAADAAGNADETPATWRFKVVKPS